MKHRARNLLYCLCLLLVAVGTYFLTFGHCFLPRPKTHGFAGESIEIRDYESSEIPSEAGTFDGWLARTKWKLTCPGQVRLLEAGKIPPPDSFSWLQTMLTRLGYDFPHGCFATDVEPHSIGKTFKFRIAHYPSVLNTIQKDLNLKLIAGPPRTDLTDPGPEFQKTFAQADLIEFVSSYPQFGKGVVTVENPVDVRQFFEILQFVPYDKGSSWTDSCADDEEVSAYADGVLLGTFAIHQDQGSIVRWKPLGTDVHLTPESAASIEEYLDRQVYGNHVPVEVMEKQAPMLKLNLHH